MVRRGPGFTQRKAYFPPPRKDMKDNGGGGEARNANYLTTTAGVRLQLTNGAGLSTTKG